MTHRPRADLAGAKARVVLAIRRAVRHPRTGPALPEPPGTRSSCPASDRSSRRRLQPERLIRAPDVPIEAGAASRLIPYRPTTRRSSRPPPRATSRPRSAPMSRRFPGSMQTAERWNHDHRRAEVQGRPNLGHHVVRRHLEPAVRHRAAHLPALHQAPGRVAHPRRAQGRPHRPPDREAAVHPPPERAPLVAFQGAGAGADVRDGARPGVPLHQVATSDRRLRRRIDLHPSHEGRALHDAHASGAGQRGRPARRHRHGRPRHQGRPLRVHARQDRHRRPRTGSSAPRATSSA